MKLKKNELKKMRKNNPNLFKEDRREKQERLEREEQYSLDSAVVKSTQTMLWQKAK